MRLTVIKLSLLMGALLLLASRHLHATETKVLSDQKNIMMKKSGSRIPAPQVLPITHNGIRYEQVRNGLLAGLDQMGGYLVAKDDTSGELLWTLKVYENPRQAGKEGDVQDIFFKAMQLQSDGTLLIENERAKRFVVDPSARSVVAAP